MPPARYSALVRKYRRNMPTICYTTQIDTWAGVRWFSVFAPHAVGSPCVIIPVPIDNWNHKPVEVIKCIQNIRVTIITISRTSQQFVHKQATHSWWNPFASMNTTIERNWRTISWHTNCNRRNRLAKISFTRGTNIQLVSIFQRSSIFFR